LISNILPQGIGEEPNTSIAQIVTTTTASTWFTIPFSQFSQRLKLIIGISSIWSYAKPRLFGTGLIDTGISQAMITSLSALDTVQDISGLKTHVRGSGRWTNYAKACNCGFFIVSLGVVWISTCKERRLTGLL
jgi:hypothetical protein